MTRGLAGLGLTVIGVMVAACGAPQFTYVANSASQTYFKVPNGWHKMSDAALAHALGGGGSLILAEPTSARQWTGSGDTGTRCSRIV